MKICGYIIALLLGVSEWGFAASQKAVLPTGVWHPSVRTGYISQISNRYSGSGTLESVGRLNLGFDGRKLEQIVPEFKKLTKLLDETFPNSRYSDQLYVGGLEFDAQADIQYVAPVMAYGVNERWTLAAGVPIVTLRARVDAVSTGTNNAAMIRNQISQNGIGYISQDLDEGLHSLENVNLVDEFNSTLTKEGYIVPTQVNRTVIGDFQMASVYQYWENKKWTLSQQTTINLPTGPEDNPDDFLDIPIFHQTYIKFDFKQDYYPIKKWGIGSLLGYTWTVQDTSLKRVPRDSEDKLPPQERKERLVRDLGDIFTLGVSTNYWLTSYLNFETGYSYSYKTADQYWGTRGYDYELLSLQTQAQWSRMHLGATFSTVDMFYNKDFSAPLMVTYLYSDIVSGINVDRQEIHELTLKMFF